MIPASLEKTSNISEKNINILIVIYNKKSLKLKPINIYQMIYDI